MKNEKILRAIGNVDDEMILDAIKDNKKNNFKWTKFVAMAAAMAILITGTVIGVNSVRVKKASAVYATVALDVNPSMEIEVNEKERVTAVRPLNDDAKKVVGDMDLNNVDIEVAINALIGSMLKNGYLSINNNSILVSVASGNTEFADKLQKKISSEINNVLKASNIDSSVMTQNYQKDDDTNKQAEEYHVSPAKATLISKIIDAKLTDAHGKVYKYEDLIELNVNELKLILESKSVELDGVTSSGVAGKGEYMTREEVLEIVYAHAGVKGSDITKLECEMDYDGNKIMYEIDFIAGSMEYEYEVDAKTGKIIETEKEPIKLPVTEPETKPTPEPETKPVTEPATKPVTEPATEPATKPVTEPATEPSVNAITKETAKEIALKDAGLKAGNVRELECELDWEYGKKVYEVDFETATTEYSYVIDAATGKILHKEAEAED